MTGERYETLDQHVARAYSDGTPPDLVPVRLCPVMVFGADECDACEAPAGYGLMDAASAWSDCNRAWQLIYRRDDAEFQRLEHETIVVWVTPAEAAKFERVLGDMRAVEPRPRVSRFDVGRWEVRAEHTAYPPEDPDAPVREMRVPIPNNDPACRCWINTDGLAFLGVNADPDCPHHGRFAGGAELPEPKPGAPRRSPLETVRQLADYGREPMTSAQREASEVMTNTLLYGQHPAPDWGAMVEDVVRVGFGRPSPVGDFPELEEQRLRILDAFDIPPQLRAEWAQIDRESLRRFLPEPQGCRRHENGTWIHVGGEHHDCPRWARG